MPSIYARDADQRRSIDDLLRKFKRIVEKNGIPSEIRRREHYEKPTAVRKRKQQAAIKRHMKRIARDQSRGKGSIMRPKKDQRRKA